MQFQFLHSLFLVSFILPPTLRLVTASVCAVSRLTVSLVQQGSTQKELLGSPNRPGTERQRGKEPVAESSDEQK
jgi:hypothetical protein